MSGVVWLVGAGVGDIGLITMRALECISQADCIVYDRLINKAVLRYARKDAELIFVGKEPSTHHLTQEQINDLLVAKARSGLSVCRLKGGDPFIFGRGGEEAEALANAGIPFEVIPGVSSYHAVPAYAGIPLTDRRYSSSVAIVTGYESGEGGDVRWEEIAHAVDTVVVLMVVGRIREVTERLMQGGLDGSTKAALIEQGTLPTQRTIIGTLATIADKAECEGVHPPAVLVVGRVVELCNKLAWFERRPLFGKRILIARDEDRGFEMARMLEAYGANAIWLPVLKIELLSNSPQMREAVIALSKGAYDWVVFTSVNGVKALFETLHSMGMDARAFSSTKVCAIGDATSNELRKEGIIADAVPVQFTTEAVADLLLNIGVQGKRILLPRAVGASRKLVNSLVEAGAEVHEVVAYNVLTNKELSEEEISAVFSKPVDIACFTSPSSVDALFKLAGEKLNALLRNTKIACIGPVTARRVEEYGLPASIIALTHTTQGLVEAILSHIATLNASVQK
jgi:uroporphyrinogen III methyltransferase/synthase